MNIYTPAEEYIIECIKKSKNPSNRKIAILGKDVDYKKIYNNINNINTKKCLMCKKDARFLSLKKGYGKFCSKTCHSKHLSEYNKKHNKQRNKKQSESLFKERQLILEAAANDYINDEFVTIKELSQKYKISYSALRYYLNRLDLTDSKRSVKIRKKNLKKEFNDINEALTNDDWVNEKIRLGWTSRNFAEHLGCSKNYVASFLRNIDNPLKGGTSSYETKIYEYLIENNITNIDQNNRSIINPYELDLYLVDQNLALEINGIYWHSILYKPKNYHVEKTSKCLENDIDLLHFYDSEIDHKWDIVKSIIGNYINQNKVIYARNCKVVKVCSEEYKTFCNLNHIQGSVSSSIKLGLIYNNELVAVMGFGKSRYNKKYEYELLRYCGKLNHNIVGGAGKLYKHFCKNYKPNGIISYSQRRLFSGKMYKSIGMQFLKYTPPNYMWINKNNEVLSRYQTQKHKIALKDDKRTENEIMMDKGYHKVYDCGQSVFVDNYKYKE